MAASFEKEIETYEAKKNELLAESAGRFVVIRERDIAGVWDTYEDALQAGYERFKLTPFLVKQITPIEPVLNFSRNVTLCQR
jgi:hypothetical protein